MPYYLRLALLTVFASAASFGIAQGQVNYALSFDGVDDYVEYDVSQTFYGAPGFTWELWFQGEDLNSGKNQMFLAYTDGANMEDIELGIGGFRGLADHLVFEVDGYGSSGAMATISYQPAGGFQNGRWYHVAAVRNFVTDSVKVYLDGILVAEQSFAGTPIPRAINSPSALGAWKTDGGSKTMFFKGCLDDVRIWNTARYEHEIVRDMYAILIGNESGLEAYWPMNEGTGPTAHDATANGRHGTLIAGPTWVTSGVTPPIPPLPPSDLTALGVSPTKIRLDWTDNAISEAQFVIEMQTGASPWMPAGNAPRNTTTFTVTGLQPDTRYSFRVKALNAMYTSAWSNTATAATLVFPPPSQLRAIPVTASSIDLTWNDESDNETGFIIQFQGGSTSLWTPFDTVPSGSMMASVTGLFPLESYSFRVCALDEVVQSDWSNIATATTLDFPAPSNLRATAVSSSDIELIWEDNTKGEGGFEIQQAIGGGDYSVLRIVPSDTTAFLVERLQPQTGYAYRVRAFDGPVYSKYSNIATATTKAFSAPTQLTATGVSSSTIELTWTDNTDESSFLIERLRSASTWDVIDTVGENVTWHPIDGLLPATEYSFRVTAIRGANRSMSSNIATARTKKYLEPPTNLTATTTSLTEIQLAWRDNASQETGFEIEIRTDTSHWSIFAGVPQNTVAFSATGLTPNTTYTFRVHAIGADAASDFSNEAAATTSVRPSAPLMLTAIPIDYANIRLAWHRGSTNEKSYDIERKDPGGDWHPAGTSKAGDTTALSAGLAELTEYLYRIRARNPIGASDWSNDARATTLARPVPAAPIALAANAISATHIALSWKCSGPFLEDAFEIEQSLTGNAGDFTRILPDAPARSTGCVIGSLKPSTTYYFRIRASNPSGVSGYSPVAHATTKSLSLPPAPFAVTASAVSGTAITVRWSAIDPSFEDGFEVWQSLSNDTATFVRLDPAVAAGVHAHTSEGLQSNTTYYFRVRAFNALGTSLFSDIARAKTFDAAVIAAFQRTLDTKEQLLPKLENIITNNSSAIVALRTILGEYPRGYDETPARELISGWRAALPSDPIAGADAMQRYTLVERIILDCVGDDTRTPPMPGAKEVAREAAQSASVCMKNLGSFALAWRDQRALVNTDRLGVLDGVMEDLSTAVFDGANTLFALMNIGGTAAGAEFFERLVHERGSIDGLTSGLLLSFTPYYQESLLALAYFQATQSLIQSYADKTRRIDISGTSDSSTAASRRRVDQIAGTIGGLQSSYASYNNVCSSLDMAYTISSSVGAPFPSFLRQLTLMRPFLVTGMWKAVSQAAIPVSRHAYLTSPGAVPRIGSLPLELAVACESVYHPAFTGFRDDPVVSTLDKRPAAPRVEEDTLAFARDRALLLELRARVLLADTAFMNAEHENIRFSGREAISAFDRRMRPMFGVQAATLLKDTGLVNAYYGAAGMVQRTKAKRALLSVSMRDFTTSMTTEKQTDLVAEIDEILGDIADARRILEDVGVRTSTLVVEPVLSLTDADLLPSNAGSDRYTLRLAMRNVGGNDMSSATLRIATMTNGASIEGRDSRTYGKIVVGAERRDSMGVVIAPGNTALVIQAEMTTGAGRSFTDRRTLRVPEHPTVGISLTPGDGGWTLENHPNPFHASTTIVYRVPAQQDVEVSIYDMLGRRLAILVRGMQHQGVHSVVFDAGAFSTGSYICRLTAGGRTMQRMLTVTER